MRQLPGSFPATICGGPLCAPRCAMYLVTYEVTPYFDVHPCISILSSMARISRGWGYLRMRSCAVTASGVNPAAYGPRGAPLGRRVRYPSGTFFRSRRSRYLHPAPRGRIWRTTYVGGGWLFAYGVCLAFIFENSTNSASISSIVSKSASSPSPDCCNISRSSPQVTSNGSSFFAHASFAGWLTPKRSSSPVACFAGLT